MNDLHLLAENDALRRMNTIRSHEREYLVGMVRIVMEQVRRSDQPKVVLQSLAAAIEGACDEIELPRTARAP
jgi:2-methylaconitate cis-trans-isomerase PrpF